MLSGLNRETEMSVMVAALTHVVAGNVPADDSDCISEAVPSNQDNCAHGDLSAKREREEGGGGSEEYKRHGRVFGDDFLHGGSSSAGRDPIANRLTVSDSPSSTGLLSVPTSTEAIVHSQALHHTQNREISREQVNQPQLILGVGGYQRQPMSLYDQMFLSPPLVSSNPSMSSSTEYSDPMFLPAQQPGEIMPATSSQSGWEEFQLPDWSDYSHYTSSSG
uniref:Uncharacterized protein n=1 Tax=Populus alba TaxID=43335 RepID=A0A4U5N7M6_POPAL|nr:hypothetical protein D5086_0000279840 [Populus alba]